MRYTKLSWAILIPLLCQCQAKIQYPDTPAGDTVDTYFGCEVADPYRWLEDDTAEETEAWVKAQNEVTRDYLDKIRFITPLKEEMKSLTDYTKVGAPTKKGGRYYFFKNDGLQNQSIMYVKDALDGEPRLFFNPNTLSENGVVALAGFSFSKNAKYFAYIVSRSGSDWREIYVMDVATGKLLPDHIEWAKFTGADWIGDEGFYYSAYDAPKGDGKEFSNQNTGHKIYYHRLGDAQAQDQLVFHNPEKPLCFYTSGTDDSSRYLFVSESGEGLGNTLFVKNLKARKAKFTQITFDNHYTYIPVDVVDGELLLYTNYEAPNYKIVKMPIAAPKISNRKDLVPERESVLSSVDIIAQRLFLSYKQDVTDHIYRYDLKGNLIDEIKLPGLGSAGISGDKTDNEAFITFTSFTDPSSIYRYDVEKNETTLYQRPEVNFNPDDFETCQIFYPSKDGTRIPMFLVHKKGIKLNGNNPVLIYGYGGFNITYGPSFSTFRIPFLERGGIYALANIRGGGEYGETWHQAGIKLDKQNVFDDFIGAAEFLVKEGYTNPEKIAIIGGSNGGLLVGACVNQRPDLFRVAIPQVGVMDMLRYHKFTIGWNWAGDYGTSEESEEMFRALLAYSPYHNLKAGVKYPAILVTTADHDDRVVPAHSFKYAAALQAANGGDNPTLIRIESEAGHGSGKPMSKIIEEQADIYGFIMYNLGMKY